MYLTYKNRFWGHFFVVLELFFHFYVWTRSGSKLNFYVLVSTGLILHKQCVLHKTSNSAINKAYCSNICNTIHMGLWDIEEQDFVQI